MKIKKKVKTCYYTLSSLMCIHTYILLDVKLYPGLNGKGHKGGNYK